MAFYFSNLILQTALNKKEYDYGRALFVLSETGQRRVRRVK